MRCRRHPERAVRWTVLISLLVLPVLAPTPASARATAWNVSGIAATGSAYNLLNAVDCTSATFCAAVGASSASANGLHRVLVETSDGATWTVATTPTITNSNDDELLSVSCTSSTSCTAVGYWSPATGGNDTTHDVHQALIESYNGSGWSIEATPDAFDGPGSQLSGVSCTSATACTAVGYTGATGTFSTLVQTYDGSSWTESSSPDIGNGWYNTLTSVSCVSASAFCAAVGFAKPSNTDNDPSVGDSFDLNSTGSGGIPIAMERKSGTWLMDTSVRGSGIGYQDNLYGVSCVSSSFCAAVGGSNGVGNSGSPPFTSIYDGTGWSRLLAPVPDEGTNEFGVLYGVTCVSTSVCTAGGSYSAQPDASGKSPNDMLVEDFNSASWDPPSFPPTSNDTYATMLGLSCVSDSSCAGVGTATSSVASTSVDGRPFGTPWFTADLSVLGAGSGAFTPPPPSGTLTVSIDALPDPRAYESVGSGTVTSTPAGITCPGTCTAAFPPGTQVTLHETADDTSVVDTGNELSNACTPTGDAFYASQDCTVTTDANADFRDVEFKHIEAKLAYPGAVSDPTDPGLVGVVLDGCASTGASSYEFEVDGAAVGSAGPACSLVDNLPLGTHNVSLNVADADGQRTAIAGQAIQVTPVAAFSWTVDPIPYGTDRNGVTTQVHLDSCGSVGVGHFVWHISQSGIPDKVTTSCHYTVSLPVDHTFTIQLTVVDPNGGHTVTSAPVPVVAVYSASSGCTDVSLGQDACWRHGLDWFGDAFGFSNNPMRPPDYAVVAVGGDIFGTGVTGNVAVTCDGNIYYGDGVSLGAGLDLPVTAVLAFGYIGDPSTAAPPAAYIDDFVGGETETLTASFFGTGVSYVHSDVTDPNDPNQGRPTVGVEYLSGLIGPGLAVSASYDQQFSGDQTAAPGTFCQGGVTASPVWQTLMNQPVQSGAGLPTYNPLKGSAPSAGQGATIYTNVPADTFAPGTDVTVSLHSTLRTLKTVAATDAGAIGARLHIPRSLKPGVHTLILTGIAPNGKSGKTLTIRLPVRTRLAGHGYWLVNSAGTVSAFGAAKTYRASHSQKVRGRVIALAGSADGHGYWLSSAAGHVYAFGDAKIYHRSSAHPRFSGHAVALAATADGHGYWLTTAAGHVFAFGDARTYRADGKRRLTGKVVAFAASPDNAGYWLTTAAGHVYAFGDARTLRPRPKQKVHGPVVAFAATPNGGGCWLATTTGHVVAFGNAKTYGLTAGQRVKGRVVGLTATPSGRGYWLTSAAGHVYAFGDARRLRRADHQRLGRSVVAMTDL
jgi:hypothetical protein